MQDPVLFFSPGSAPEAAEIFRACGAAADRGRKIRVGVVESPFRPADGVALPDEMSSLEEIESLDGAGEALVLLGGAAMAGICEISRRDFLAVVGGGAKFAPFVEEVRKAGLYFPHEPDLMAREATIAEIVMDGTIFGTEGRYGRLREYVLSLELVTPAGEIIRCGSRSVKDVTGYDIAGFLMGGGGLCGMIAKATIRLLPLPGTRLDFLCAGDRRALEELAREIHGKLDAAFLEIYPEEEGTRERARLIGRLQSAVRGREEALLDNLSRLAPRDVLVLKLDPAGLEEFRRLPVLALEGLKAPRRLFHVVSSVEPASAPPSGARRFTSLFPARYHYYIESESPGLVEPMAQDPDGRIESIEMRDGRVFRRRLRREGKAAGLARALHRVFDPREIMLP